MSRRPPKLLRAAAHGHADSAGVEVALGGFRVIENDVVLAAEPFAAAPAVAVTPDDLIAKSATRRAEYSIEQQLQIVAGAGVAMEEETAGRAQDAVDLGKALRHADEIGEQTALPHYGLEALQQAYHGRRVAARGEGLETLAGGFIPAPRVRESAGIRACPIVPFGVEGRIDIAEIDGPGGDMVAQHQKVVAAEQPVPIGHDFQG